MLKGFVSGEEKDIKRIPMKVGNEYKEGWEVRDNQDRLIWGREDELQTATGTLPFKGYALPLKVKSLLGNAVQNGTPAPDNIITPEMCGVRTAQTIPYPYELPTTETSGVTFSVDSDGRITATGRTTANLTAIIRRNIGMLTAGTYTFSVTGKHEGLILYVRDMVAQATIANILSGSTSTSTTFTLAENTSNEIRVYMTRAVGYDVDFDCTVQLEKGSTATEHEPYGWKVPFENHGENLFNIDGKNTENGYADNTELLGDGTTKYWENGETSEYITVSSNAQYTLTNMGSYNAPGYCFYTESKEYISGSGFNGRSVITFTTPSNCKYVRFTHVKTQPKTMLNLGSTAKPYSPYLNATIPVYLGEVPTVRRVRKLVLTGEENWEFFSDNSGVYGTWQFYVNAVINGLPFSSALSNIAGYGATASTRSNYQYGAYLVTSGTGVAFQMAGAKDIFTGLTSWKSYLASEYAAGTPVTVWYVLAEPTTGISNEPLCKISTYADELTTIQVHGLSAPLYGIGDYKDTLNLSTGVVTRKVMKLVLDGTENIEIKSGNAKWYIPIADMKIPDNFGVIDWYCSHYRAVSNSATWTSYDYMISWSTVDSGLSIGLRIRDIDFLTSTTVADFKAYLAAQYANGTPVTIWYVLSTPETETVTVPTGMTGEIEGYLTQVSTPSPTNRSVPKWNGVEESGGTYAVTVYTPPEIQTTTGQNTLTVETDLEPSNLTVKGHIKELT